MWESLKSPDAVQDIVDNDTIPVLLNKGEFVLAFDQSRDLVLRTTDAKPLVYWSLKRTLFKGGDLSQVAYAGTNFHQLINEPVQMLLVSLFIWLGLFNDGK